MCPETRGMQTRTVLSRTDEERAGQDKAGKVKAMSRIGGDWVVSKIEDRTSECGVEYRASEGGVGYRQAWLEWVGQGRTSWGVAVLGLEPSLAGGHQVVGQICGQVVAVQLDVDEVHGQGELISVQHPIPVDI